MRTKLLILIMLCSIGFTSCFDGPWTDVRDAPYRAQRGSDWCGIACIQMWSEYNNRNPLPIQDEIASWVAIHADHQPSIGFSHEGITKGVGQFTDSRGYLVEANVNNLGQDQCLSAGIASIKDFRLSILPFSYGDHAVLAYGYKWHYNENSKRIADEIYYHDPLDGPSIRKSAADVKAYYYRFDPRYNSYWIIVGRGRNSSDGWDGYMSFITEGGTFYGGPKVYNPVTWDPNTPY